MAGSWSVVSGNSEIKTDFCPGTGNALPCVPFSFQGQEAGGGSGASTAKTGSAGTQPDRAEQKQSAPSPVSRRFVLMFGAQFAQKVESGAKMQTVRRTPKRMPRAGDIFDGRAWSGLPYASAQRKLMEAPICKVSKIEIRCDGMWLDGTWIPLNMMYWFAASDGFHSTQDMLEWFASSYGLPFVGIVIYWSGIPETAFADGENPRLEAGTEGGEARPSCI